MAFDAHARSFSWPEGPHSNLTVDPQDTKSSTSWDWLPAHGYVLLAFARAPSLRAAQPLVAAARPMFDG